MRDELSAILNALKSEIADTKYEAAILLGEYEEIFNVKMSKKMQENITFHLLPLLNDKNDHVRYYTAEAIGKIGVYFAISKLKKRLNIEKKTKNNTVNVVFSIEKAIQNLKKRRNQLASFNPLKNLQSLLLPFFAGQFEVDAPLWE